MQTFDVAVVGTGQGGVPLAIDLAGSGKRNVVFERSAHGAGRARRAADIGVHADVRVDFWALMERVRATVADWNGGVEAKFAELPEIALVRAEASVTGPHTLEAGGDRRTQVIGGGYIGLELGDGTTYALQLADGSTVEAEALLVATGRVPIVPPGTAAAGIALDARGYIAVDAHLRTSVPRVFALGDVAGQPQFTHVSWEDYRRLKAILNRDLTRTRADRVLGFAVFTDPQVGRVGLTHEAALKAGHDVRCVTLELENVARAIEWNGTNGFYRMVVDTTTSAILGATLVGYEASELVHVFLAHMEAGSTWQKLEQSVHIHPTYAEALPSLARLLAG
jgi:pyruvate/2-oxoglutarate dehydrogenase complex dihydrolipoamide dehydrogenase (E3) component